MTYQPLCEKGKAKSSANTMNRCELSEVDDDLRQNNIASANRQPEMKLLSIYSQVNREKVEGAESTYRRRCEGSVVRSREESLQEEGPLYETELLPWTTKTREVRSM